MTTTLNELTARVHDLRDLYDEETSPECRVYIKHEIYSLTCQIEHLQRLEEMAPDVVLDWYSVKIAALVTALIVACVIFAGPRPW